MIHRKPIGIGGMFLSSFDQSYPIHIMKSTRIKAGCFVASDDVSPEGYVVDVGIVDVIGPTAGVVEMGYANMSDQGYVGGRSCAQTRPRSKSGLQAS